VKVKRLHLYFLDPDGNLLELVGYRPKGGRT